VAALVRLLERILTLNMANMYISRFYPMAFGFGILLLDEGRKYLVRKKPNSLIAKAAW
jgi:hypothetical protein